LGRTKGGFSTKLHLACDAKGRPLSVVLTPAQRHGSTQLEALLDAVRVPRPEGTPARPRKHPEHLIADRGYSFSKVAQGYYAGAASPTPSPNPRTRKSVAPGVRGGVRASTGKPTSGATTWSRGA
jgi:hypothetical protein